MTILARWMDGNGEKWRVTLRRGQAWTECYGRERVLLNAGGVVLTVRDVLCGLLSAFAQATLRRLDENLTNLDDADPQIGRRASGRTEVR
jgi:hypothetical protein